VLHEIRSEYAQLLTVTFLLIVGAGPWSLDALLMRRKGRAQSAEPPKSSARSTAKELADIH
jgi:putative oxidoreductase